MNARVIAWALVDVAALGACALLVVLGHAPVSLFTATVATVVSVRLVARGGGGGDPPAAPPGARGGVVPIVLGAGDRDRPPGAHRVSGLVALCRGAALLARAAARTGEHRPVGPFAWGSS